MASPERDRQANPKCWLPTRKHRYNQNQRLRSFLCLHLSLTMIRCFFELHSLSIEMSPALLARSKSTMAWNLHHGAFPFHRLSLSWSFSDSFHAYSCVSGFYFLRLGLTLNPSSACDHGVFCCGGFWCSIKTATQSILSY